MELFLGTLGVCVAALIVYLVRRDHLHVDHGLSWIVVAAGFAGLGFAPGIVDWIAARLGIGYAPILAVSLAIVVMAIKILLMDIDRSRIETRNQRLTQRLAMLEGELQALQEASGTPTERAGAQDREAGEAGEKIPDAAPGSKSTE
jgi:hypothetical protein